MGLRDYLGAAKELAAVDNPVAVVAGYLRGEEYTLRTRGGAEFTGKRGSGLLGAFAAAKRQGFTLRPYDDDLFLAEKDTMQLLGRNFEAVSDEFAHYRDPADPGATVLDIGGYLGETAIRFVKEAGCEEVIVYEPVPENVAVMRDAVAMNDLEDRIDIRQEAVGPESGQRELRSTASADSPAFGLEDGEVTRAVETRSWTDVLKEAADEDVTLVKVDCEGCEAGLADVDADLLRQFPAWVVETHSTDIRASLTDAFTACGFSTTVCTTGTYPETGAELSVVQFRAD